MLFLYALVPAVLLGGLNGWYWRKQGFTSITQMLLGVVIFYAISYKVLEYFLS